ncbi:hypothetical protein QJS10_CPA16g01378 [Acorus calamus]|uniref:Uncharacterized protein n=1 Tax=Acorus calamus TaxID=4465 RepID=A0AAV9D3H6_ACOCL|nr:hypothetical protein QJS10_CPA16g01378 [Acorus calamus]
MDVEEDVFFADLSKWISLLILDDEDEDGLIDPSLSLQALSHTAINPIPPSIIPYEQSCPREIKGTGVFIPRCSVPNRKNRSNKSGPYNNSSHSHHNHHQKQQQQPDKSRAVHRVSNGDASGVPRSNCYNNNSRWLR